MATLTHINEVSIDSLAAEYVAEYCFEHGIGGNPYGQFTERAARFDWKMRLLEKERENYERPIKNERVVAA